MKKNFFTCCTADVTDNQRIKSFSAMQVQYVCAAVQLLCYLLTCTESRRCILFQDCEKQVQNMRKAVVLHTDLLRTRQQVTISSSNPWTAITCTFWSLLFWSLDWWLKDERLCSWSVELLSPPNLLSSVCVRLQNKCPFSCSMITVVKWESGAFSCYCPQCKVWCQQNKAFQLCCQNFPA